MTAPAEVIGFEKKLHAIFDAQGPLAIAVSGGVDSMTLAYLAHRHDPNATIMIHAVSPAVPERATQRVRHYAERYGWQLTLTGTGEFDDPRYRTNPLDRCYFCKTNLYDRIRVLTTATIASGANLDDLGDFRPGLAAAREAAVIHPYVQASISKNMVRAIAHLNDLTDLAELPAQPCLASRVETGIAISAEDLAFVDLVEQSLGPLFPGASALRCRITHAGVAIEVDDVVSPNPAAATALVEKLCLESGRQFVGLRPYRKGAAFLRPLE
jgi:pyridinium-3,5-biscarboxylic acid mononucleotide sulfurtransferase